MQNKALILTFVIVVFILGALLYIYNPTPTEYSEPNQPEQVFCTADAMLCPDGSYVGRTGPNCEFQCPGGDGLPEVPIFEDGTILE